MEITGTITQVFPVQSGTSKSSGNAWQKQSFIVEYVHGEFAKQIMLDTMDEKVVGKLVVGMEVSVKFDFTVRQWQREPGGEVKYFNEPRIWRDGLHCISKGQQAAQQYQQPVQQPPQISVPQPTQSSNSDPLPF